MGLRLEVIGEATAMESLAPAWSELAGQGGKGSLFRSPEWLLPWWHAYRGVLGAEPLVLAGYDDGGTLVCLAPLYRRTARISGFKVREIRLLGDAGPRPPALDLLVAPGFEEASGIAMAEHLRGCSQDWDVIDFEPLQDPSRVRAFLVNRLASAGFHVDSSETGGARRIAIDVPISGPEMSDPLATEYTTDQSLVRKGLSVLRRLSRLEWADREENSPIADAQATQLLEEVATRMAPSDRARVARIETRDGAALAAALVVDDGPRAVVVAMGVDPEARSSGAAKRLLTAQALTARGRGQTALDLVIGANEYDLPDWPHSRQRALRVSVYGHAPAAAVARGYGAVRRSVEAARGAPGAAAASARAAWSKIRTAASGVAERERLHLYRGELWTRGIEPHVGLELRSVSQADFDALSSEARQQMVEMLELDEAYCRSKWARGDFVVYATIDGQPAGIGWCARKDVFVPEIERTLRLGRHEAYIHDLFVAPSARGRAVAPSMLEFIAHELRQKDVYRSWALIGYDNAASIRAFEKAAYTAVADVIYTRVGAIDRVVLRPPDPEAEQLFGLD